MPVPRQNESRDNFIDRCMDSPEANRDFPNGDQRFAFCQSQWERRNKTSDAEFTRTVSDREGFAITSREVTDQGYLRVPGRVARSGIQHYLASELQLKDRPPNEVVAVYRPPEEVFSDQSLQSYADADVTDGHPPRMVDAETFKTYSRGHATDAGRRDGDFVVADLIIKDRRAIEAVEKGKVNLSAGYDAEYHREPGVTDDGEAYEFVQRNIRINHVALVDRARAGQEARLFDHNRNRGTAMNVTTRDGKSITVQDEATAQLVQSVLDADKEQIGKMEQKAKEMEDEAKELREEAEKMKADLDKTKEERDEALKAASDEAISERLKALSEVRDAARRMAGDEFTCDSVNTLEVKRAALAKVRPSMDWADKSEHYVQAAWDMEVERSAADRAADKAKGSHDGLADDLGKQYQTADGQPVGTVEYQKFLSGGKH